MVTFTVHGVTIEAETQPDLFSPKGLDQGTQLLLASFTDKQPSHVKDEASKPVILTQFQGLADKQILDWGCGWGAIALYLATIFPDAVITAIDSDIAAVKATSTNTDLNSLTNLNVLASHSYSELPVDQTFDLIVSNPPTHRGREIVDSMIAQAKDRLNDGGMLMLVVEARIKPWAARQMTEVFGNHKILKRGPKNVVLISTK